MVLLSSDTQAIQTAFSLLEKDMLEDNLYVNPSKCEYLSDDVSEVIKPLNPQENIPTVQMAKYCGQTYNCGGQPIAEISRKKYGKMLDILINSCGLSKASKIILFNTFIRSSVAHLLPQITLSGQIANTWKELRKIIFRHVIDGSTMPREASALYSCSYYDTIIRPLVKLLERDQRMTGDQEQSEFLRDSARPAFSNWLVAEPNLDIDVKTLIADVVESKRWATTQEWDTLIKTKAVKNCSETRTPSKGGSHCKTLDNQS